MGMDSIIHNSNGVDNNLSCIIYDGNVFYTSVDVDIYDHSDHHALSVSIRLCKLASGRR